MQKTEAVRVETHMVRRTARDVGQLAILPQRRIKLIALRLGTMILPIRRERVAKCTLFLRSPQLLLQVLASVQSIQQGLCLVAPVDAAVLLAGAADAADAVQRSLLVDEPRQDQVDGLEPHGDGGKDLTLGLVEEDALAEAILLTKVGIEVDLGFRDDLKIGLDDDSCAWGNGEILVRSAMGENGG